MIFSLPSFARDIEYTHENQTLIYTVIDEEAKTVKTKAGTVSSEDEPVAGNAFSGNTYFNLVIPSQIEVDDVKYDVIEIGEYGFYKGRLLKSVTIPNSVKKIGAHAFESCTLFTSFTIPNSVKEIGEYAFYDCYNITSVTISESVTEIKGNVFSECWNLTSVSIPNSVKKIGKEAFYNCYRLTSVSIPNSVTEIGESAFELCGLTSITIPNSLTEIRAHTFEYCPLTSVSIPSSVTEIGEDAFVGCYPTYAEFASIEALCRINFANPEANPLRWGSSLYIDGKEVTSLIIPESVTEIKDYAFYGCESLTSVSIPGSVTKIGEEAFSYCEFTSAEFASIEALCGIDFADENANPLAFGWRDGSKWYPCLLYIDGKEVTSLTIPESVTEIKDYAFYNCRKLTSINISEGVTSIGSYAFYMPFSINVPSITIPQNITSIGKYAFQGIYPGEITYLADEPIEAKGIFYSSVSTSATLYMSEAGAEYVEKNNTEPWCNFTNIKVVEGSSAIDEVIADFDVDAPCEVFLLTGVKVADTTVDLPAGIYIVRQGDTVKKIAVN
ncbi:MAG: leucine-rich repeat domain-containing protein [Duncaniella sp.]|nr:leucine-rich repeat domain-containing protein [Duncaniella sp.]